MCLILHAKFWAFVNYISLPVVTYTTTSMHVCNYRQINYLKSPERVIKACTNVSMKEKLSKRKKQQQKNKKKT